MARYAHAAHQVKRRLINRANGPTLMSEGRGGSRDPRRQLPVPLHEPDRDGHRPSGRVSCNGDAHERDSVHDLLLPSAAYSETVVGYSTVSPARHGTFATGKVSPKGHI